MHFSFILIACWSTLTLRFYDLLQFIFFIWCDFWFAHATHLDIQTNFSTVEVCQKNKLNYYKNNEQISQQKNANFTEYGQAKRSNSRLKTRFFNTHLNANFGFYSLSLFYVVWQEKQFFFRFLLRAKRCWNISLLLMNFWFRTRGESTSDRNKNSLQFVMSIVEWNWVWYVYLERFMLLTANTEREKIMRAHDAHAIIRRSHQILHKQYLPSYFIKAYVTNSESFILIRLSCHARLKSQKKKFVYFFEIFEVIRPNLMYRLYSARV